MAAARLDLRTQLEQRGSHFEAYNQVDVALDTYPYNGATTTCEALWMGVPVISLRGSTHTSRMGASILAAAGKREWVAASVAQYVELAATTALDTMARQRWRLQARASLRDSPLLDEAGFSRDFESALCAAWAADDPVPA